MEDGPTGLSSRDAYENSNACIAEASSGSGFIAAIDVGTEEIFSPDLAHNPVMPLSTARVCAFT
jgi:hypothetical protein